MRITIEPTDDVAQLANVSQGTVWRGVTESGTPVIAIVVSLGCRPEDQPAFDRDFAKSAPPAEDDGGAADDESPDDAPLPQPARA